MKKSIRELYAVSVAIFLLEIFLILVFFRKLRSIFPPPPIEKSGIVGFAQYFGYPFYFETIVFLVVVISPFVIVSIIKYLKKQ